MTVVWLGVVLDTFVAGGERVKADFACGEPFWLAVKARNK